MKKLFILITLSIFSTSCIKKSAVRFDKNLIGTWYTKTSSGFVWWLIVKPNGETIYASYDNYDHSKFHTYEGKAKYSLFDRKFYVKNVSTIGDPKFKVLHYNSPIKDGANILKVVSFYTKKDTFCNVDRYMQLKASLWHGSYVIDFYRAY